MATRTFHKGVFKVSKPMFEQRSSQLRPRQSRRDRSLESHCQRMGSFIRGSREYVCLPYPPCSDSPSLPNTTALSVAFGHILTRLTAAKEEGAFVTTPDGSKVALGIPKAQKEAAGSNAYADIPLRRPGTATEAASVILAVASPLFSYVNGQTIMVSSLYIRKR